MVSVSGQLCLLYPPFEELIDYDILRAHDRPISPDEDFHRLARVSGATRRRIATTYQDRHGSSNVPRFLSIACVAFLLCGCWTHSGPEVVVYTALDSEFSEPIFAEFTRQTGIVVRPKFDTEATKTVGLANAILAERRTAAMRCLLEQRDPEHLATAAGRAARLLPAGRRGNLPRDVPFAAGRLARLCRAARVLIVNTELVPEAEQPTSIRDLADPKWRGKAGIAKPLFGTTATHAACLFAHWGDDEAKRYFQDIRDNDVRILAGNKQVALSVASGQLALGITDTDDAVIEREKGMPVEIVYPDQGDGGVGTLFIPNTLGIIAGGPNPREARRLVEYLLSSEVEARLAAGPVPRSRWGKTSKPIFKWKRPRPSRRCRLTSKPPRTSGTLRRLLSAIISPAERLSGNGDWLPDVVFSVTCSHKM